MADPCTVHIIDDNASFRWCVQKSLECAGFTCRAHESARQFLDELNAEIPGCVVLDLRMPEIDGLTLLRQLRAGGCKIPVIVLSAYADVSTTVEAMKLGAMEVLQKPLVFTILIAAVRLAWEKSLRDYGEKLAQEDARKRFDDLSPRELELLELIVEGCSNKQIACKLNISVKTVFNHRAHLMAKTRAGNAADLARLATQAGLIPIH